MKTVRCARDFVVNDVTSIDQSERSNGTQIKSMADGGISTLSSDTEEDTQIRCVPRLLWLACHQPVVIMSGIII